MARFSGKIGFVTSVETTPSVYEDVVVERSYRGDVVRNNVKWQPTSEVNENLNVSNSISVVADDYAYEHIGYMRYLIWRGIRFKISNIDIQSPRLILSIGGIYNGPTAQA